MMKVAKQNVTLIDSDGRPVELKAGISHISDEDFLVQAYPNAFRAAAPEHQRQREAIRPTGEPVRFTPASSIAIAPPRASAVSPSAATPRLVKPARPDYGREVWRMHASTPDMQVDDSPSRTRVRLVARGEILRMVARTTGTDGLEAGGVLLGGRVRS
jgi:hypothetical protein